MHTRYADIPAYVTKDGSEIRELLHPSLHGARVLLGSYGIVIAYLNRVGLSARDPFDCPMVQQFRRA